MSSADGSYRISDFHVGDVVKCFHPHTLGVVHAAIVMRVGRKYLYVQFNPATDTALGTHGKPIKIRPDKVVFKIGTGSRHA